MMHEIACRHCQANRERAEELEEEVRQLREQLAGTAVTADDIPFRVLRLTRSEEQVLRMLMARDLLTTEAYMAVRAGDDWDGPDKILDVFICKLRKKLTPYGIGIVTIWGRGWSLDAGAKDKIMALTTDSAEPVTPAPMSPRRLSPQRYDEVQVAVITALELAPFGLTWYALRRSANVGDSKLTQAVQTLMNGGRLRRDFARAGNRFVYSLEREAIAS